MDEREASVMKHMIWAVVIFLLIVALGFSAMDVIKLQYKCAQPETTNHGR
jgi:hypothetical protein